MGMFLLANDLRGRSAYPDGVTTVMGLLLISIAVQMQMFAVLSRQIEGLQLGRLQRCVPFRRVGNTRRGHERQRPPRLPVDWTVWRGVHDPGTSTVLAGLYIEAIHGGGGSDRDALLRCRG